MAYVSDYPRATTSNARSYLITFEVVLRAAMSLYAFFRGLFGWRPTAYEHLHLDRMGHTASISPQQAIRRSRSYRMRALLHQLFTGCGFVEPTAVGTA